ncbi:MAG TPA: hypothetical protein VIR00_13555 [Micromonosporaceae bacterium]|jgi:hypothetical protein
MARLVTGYAIRPVEVRGGRAALAVFDAERLPGQSLATSAMPAVALAGRLSVDSWWWAGLADVTTEVATTGIGPIAGVVACGLAGDRYLTFGYGAWDAAIADVRDGCADGCTRGRSPCAPHYEAHWADRCGRLS